MINTAHSPISDVAIVTVIKEVASGLNAPAEQNLAILRHDHSVDFTGFEARQGNSFTGPSCDRVGTSSLASVDADRVLPQQNCQKL